MLSKQIHLRSTLGEKRTILLLWGANCSTSILFIALWMFLLTAHLCADWAVKTLSSCSEWTGSHIQGHYTLGVRKIKHQIRADLGPFNCLSWTQRSQPGFFSLLKWNNFLGPLLWCIIMSEFQLSSQLSLGRLPWQRSNRAWVNVCVCMCVCMCVCAHVCLYVPILLALWGPVWAINLWVRTFRESEDIPS